MQHSNFMLLFRNLSQREVQEFERFLKALYPKQKVCHLLFDYCRRYRNKKEDKYWNKEQVFLLVFPEETPKDKRKKITDTLSDLNLRLQEYLLWQNSKKRTFEHSFAILKIYKERKLHELLLQGLKQLQRQLQKDKKGRNMWWNLQMTRLYHMEFYEAPILRLKLKESKNPLRQAIKHLTAFFRGALLKYACETANRAFILQEKYEVDGLKNVLTQTPADDALQKLYRQFYNLLEKRDQAGFLQTKKEFLARKDLHIEEVEVCLTYLINLGIQFSKEGDLLYTKQLLELYRYGLEKKIFLIDHKLQSTKFLNIIDLSCKVNDLTGANDFIHTYKSYLPVGERLVVTRLGQAIIAFAKKDFSAVLTLLRDLQTDTIEHDLRAKTLIICAMCEENLPENVILDYCASFLAFLRRNKVIGRQTQKGFQNFARIVKLLVNRKISRQKIQNELSEAKAIFMKYWLQKQIDKYENR